jgi:hypothetical protein
MATVLRLVTVVDLDDRPVRAGDAPLNDGPPPEGAVPALAPVTSGPNPNDARTMSLSAVHLAVLDNGRRLVLLDDRGWGVHGPPDIWRHTSFEEIERDARMVVGPDEAYGDQSRADREADHWSSLAGILQRQGVVAGADELRALPHDVEPSERLRARLGGM